MPSRSSRAMGALLGQVVGDALGSQLEFKSAASIRNGSMDILASRMLGSPVWGTIPGQITDDSEMAIAALAAIQRRGSYVKDEARAGYQDWLDSHPFDCGFTVGSAIRTGRPSADSRSNGSMMRCSPIAVWGSTVSPAHAAVALKDDAEITHADPVVVDSTMLYGLAIRRAVMFGVSPSDLYDYVLIHAESTPVHPVVREYVRRAAEGRPQDTDEGYQTGYCMVAFQHALYSLISGESFSDALTNTIMCGGDTDTNAAIVGALLGAAHGEAVIPAEWVDAVLGCVPDESTSQPRPERFHVSNMMRLAKPIIASLDN